MKEKIYTVYSNLNRIVTVTANTVGGYVKHIFKPAENVISESVFKEIKDTEMFK